MVTGPRRPNRDSPPQTVSRPFTGNSPGRLRLAMKLSAAHQPSCYVGRLQQSVLGRQMGSQIPRDANKNMPALVAVAPLAKLPHARLDHLVGMESRVLPKQRLRKGCD